MNKRTLAVVLAAFLALAAAVLVAVYVRSVQTQAGRGENAQLVLVAREDIPARTPGEAAVENGLVEQRRVPAAYVANGALSMEAQLKGKVIQTGFTSGQQIVAGQLGDPAAQSLSYQVKKGMRAISLPIDRVTGVGGQIRAGDRIDVVATFDFDILNSGNIDLGQALGSEERERIRREIGIDIGASKSSVTKILLQQVEVLRVDGQEAQGETKGPGVSGSPVVIVMVSPADVERLVFAQQQAKISYALVPSEDREFVKTSGRAIVNEFHEDPRSQPPQPATQPASNQ